MLTKQKIKKLVIIAITMSVLSLLCIFHNTINPFIVKGLSERFNVVTNRNNLLVHFINVDQADAVAINLPDGKAMLIDNGSKYVNVNYVNYIKENVIQSKIHNKIDYLVLTHADSDHVGGTMKLLKNFYINMVFMPKIISNSATFQEIYDYVTKYCNYQLLGDGFKIQNIYEITFFESLNNSNTNDSSQVIKLNFKNKSFLFAADISADTEKEYVKVYGSELDCDILKVAHHGSDNSTSQEFLNVVTPDYAVISVGANNLYGHPTEEVLKRLHYNDIYVYRTDIHDDILFIVGEEYNLNILHGNYYITSMSLDYTTYILVLDICLMITAIVIIIKKEKKKSRHRRENFLE